MDIPKILYHYTSLDTFYEIVKNKELWLCDILDSNDSKELKETDEIFKELIHSFEKEKLFLFGELENTKTLYELYKAPAHVVCFSEYADTLSQWSEYGDACKGISIGFNMEIFNINKGEVRYSFIGNGDLGIFRVVYFDENERSSLMLEIEDNLGEVSRLLKQFIKLDPLGQAHAKQEILHNIRSIAYDLANKSRYYKNKSFQSEKEWRIIYLPMIENECSNSTFRIHGSIKEINFMKNKRFRTYFKYKLPVENNSNPFKEIILGAKADIDEKKIKMFLHANGFWGTEIKRSQIPYR